MASLLLLLNIDLPVPYHTTLSRRCTDLVVSSSTRRAKTNATDELIHVIVDSIRMKIYDACQWLRAKSGVKFSRKWRKLHLAIDAETLTDQNTSDISRFQICLDRLNSRLPVSGAIVLITVIEFTKLYAAITSV